MSGTCGGAKVKGNKLNKRQPIFYAKSCISNREREGGRGRKGA